MALSPAANTLCGEQLLCCDDAMESRGYFDPVTGLFIAAAGRAAENGRDIVQEEAENLLQDALEEEDEEDDGEEKRDVKGEVAEAGAPDEIGQVVLIFQLAVSKIALGLSMSLDWGLFGVAFGFLANVGMPQITAFALPASQSYEHAPLLVSGLYFVVPFLMIVRLKYLDLLSDRRFRDSLDVADKSWCSRKTAWSCLRLIIVLAVGSIGMGMYYDSCAMTDDDDGTASSEIDDDGTASEQLYCDAAYHKQLMGMLMFFLFVLGFVLLCWFGIVWFQRRGTRKYCVAMYDGDEVVEKYYSEICRSEANLIFLFYQMTYTLAINEILKHMIPSPRAKDMMEACPDDMTPAPTPPEVFSLNTPFMAFMLIPYTVVPLYFVWSVSKRATTIQSSTQDDDLKKEALKKREGSASKLGFFEIPAGCPSLRGIQFCSGEWKGEQVIRARKRGSVLKIDAQLEGIVDARILSVDGRDMQAFSSAVAFEDHLRANADRKRILKYAVDAVDSAEASRGGKLLSMLSDQSSGSSVRLLANKVRRLSLGRRLGETASESKKYLLNRIFPNYYFGFSDLFIKQIFLPLILPYTEKRWFHKVVLLLEGAMYSIFTTLPRRFSANPMGSLIGGLVNCFVFLVYFGSENPYASIPFRPGWPFRMKCAPGRECRAPLARSRRNRRVERPAARFLRERDL